MSPVYYFDSIEYSFCIQKNLQKRIGFFHALIDFFAYLVTCRGKKRSCNFKEKNFYNMIFRELRKDNSIQEFVDVLNLNFIPE